MEPLSDAGPLAPVPADGTRLGLAGDAVSIGVPSGAVASQTTGMVRPVVGVVAFAFRQTRVVAGPRLPRRVMVVAVVPVRPAPEDSPPEKVAVLLRPFPLF